MITVNTKQGGIVNEQGVATPCSNKKAFHVTWVTHNSRVSDRMLKFKVKKSEGIYFTDKQEVLITLYLKNIIKEDNLKVLAYNICKDHIHMLLVCEEDELPNLIRKLKGKSTQEYKKYLQINKDEKFSLWAQKYNNSFIDTEAKFNEVVKYIKNNRIKHNLNMNKELEIVIQNMLSSYDKSWEI